jgi:hypothetical protein
MLVIAAVIALGAIAAWSFSRAGGGPLVTVYRPASCGCCERWIAYMRHNGFRVEARNTADLKSINRTLGVPAKLSSCHTAIVGDYLVVGHVPVQAIRRMLRERPATAGLSVPGMPVGSPGMEGLYPEHYAVFLFDREGETTVYERY